MQLGDLVKPIRDLTDEELKERLQQVRHRRTVVRPAAAARVAKTAKKETQAKMSAMDKLLAGMTEEQKQQLILQLGGGGE